MLGADHLSNTSILFIKSSKMPRVGWRLAVSHELPLSVLFHKGLFKISIYSPLMLKILISSESHVENSRGAME